MNVRLYHIILYISFFSFVLRFSLPFFPPRLSPPSLLFLLVYIPGLTVVCSLFIIFIKKERRKIYLFWVLMKDKENIKYIYFPPSTPKAMTWLYYTTDDDDTNRARVLSRTHKTFSQSTPQKPLLSPSSEYHRIYQKGAQQRAAWGEKWQRDWERNVQTREICCRSVSYSNTEDDEERFV